ncbi:MAG TPA: Arm DNA-binding domain-containing protein, partial [Burkholderiales bacterium]
MTHRVFTDSYIRALKAKEAPYKRSEHAAKGEGRLTVRVLPSGTREFFYRYRVGGLDKTIALGRYDALGRNGRTLKQIGKELRDKRNLQRETGDVKEHLRAKKRRAEVEKRQGSFKQLLDAYVESL